MSVKALHLHAAPVLIPESRESGSFFARVLHSRPASAPIFFPLGMLGFFSLSVRRQMKKEKPFLPDAIYPRSLFFTRLIRFLTQIPCVPVSPSEILIDFFSFATAERAELLVLAGDRVSHREFKKNLNRLLPDLNLHAMLESRLPNERVDDTVGLIKKLAPAFIYLGEDVNDRFSLSERLRGEIPGLRALVLGAEEFDKWVMNAEFPRGSRRSLLAELAREVSSRPWRLLLAPFYFLILMDLVRVKLLNHYQVESKT